MEDNAFQKNEFIIMLLFHERNYLCMAFRLSSFSSCLSQNDYVKGVNS